MTRKGPAPRPWQDRFLEKFVQGDPAECWLWTGSVPSGPKSTGYGRFGVKAGDVRDAHRVSYEYFVGPVPEGLVLDHVKSRGCRYRHCVNPHHLEAVTHQVNLTRGDGWAGTNSRKTECPQGHAYTEENTRLHHGRRECRTCDNQRSARRRARKKESTRT